MLREELINKAKELGIKGISRMKKVDLEWAIHLKESINWFNDIAGNTITITDEDVDVSLNVTDLNFVQPNEGGQGDESLNYKMWDIPREKQMWLVS
ncbi:MAG: hypothetical protein CMJ25_15880 [Phycisphaerae bacterium]|nr:hypothetical protein [Phycisphaerae bacterium]|tara:strand:- start:8 stop:295 length:288 start_codon:yes stop_codon:yes gene_type:complete